MADDHVLDGFSAGDTRYGTRRDVSFDDVDEVLTVTVRGTDPGDYEEHHFLLTEVVRRWAPVDSPKEG